jgi:hypothetical protein
MKRNLQVGSLPPNIRDPVICEVLGPDMLRIF